MSVDGGSPAAGRQDHVEEGDLGPLWDTLQWFCLEHPVRALDAREFGPRLVEQDVPEDGRLAFRLMNVTRTCLDDRTALRPDFLGLRIGGQSVRPLLGVDRGEGVLVLEPLAGRKSHAPRVPCRV